jgi:DNA-nicking Smr family endonuclease
MAHDPPTAPTDPAWSFAEAVGPVRPLKASLNRVPNTLPQPVRRRRQSPAGYLAESRIPNPADRFIRSGDDLLFCRADVSARILDQLRRGQFAIEADIDLHGLTELAAETTLRRYLQRALRSRYRCIRVVHGKGQRSGPLGPVIKESVAFWLRHWDVVQAFASARPRDGGSGASLVLLALS